MDYRTGKCSQCGAEYKIPASFAHNVARCKVCKGVVHLGPAQSSGAAGTAESARAAPNAAESPRRSPPPRARDENPPAEREEAPANRPEVAARRESPEERPRSAPHEPRKTEPRREPVASAARTSSAPARESERAPAPLEKQKPSPALLYSGVAVLLLVVGLFVFRSRLFAGSTEPAPASGESSGAAAAGDATNPAAVDGAAAETPAPVEGEGREPSASEPERPKSGRVAKDPSSIDLARIPDFEPTPDTTAKEWSKMKEWVAQWLDEDAGAAGSRAKGELVKQGRKAVPAILNAFKRQDFATKQGRDSGDQCQKALMQISNGTNFDWRYADEAAGRPYVDPDDVHFCKHVVEQWVAAWRPAEQDIEAWIELAKLDQKAPEEAARLREMFGGDMPAPDGTGQPGSH